MKKGNNILFTLSVIALGLLPFYAFNASALYIKTDDPITIGISGSIGADTYTVNLYKPSSDGTYSISNTVEDLSGTTTLDSVITSSSIDLTTPIDNKYIFSSSWYSSADLNSTTVTTSTLSTLDGNDGTVDKTVNVYAGYYGYYAIGTTYNGSEHSINDSNVYSQLSINETQSNYSNNIYYFENNSCDIVGYASALYKSLLYKDGKHTFEHLGRDYAGEDSYCQYNELRTPSGKYKVSFKLDNLQPYNVSYLRYIRFKPPTKWEVSNPKYFALYCDKKYSDMYAALGRKSGTASIYPISSNTVELIYNSTISMYEGYLSPYNSYYLSIMRMSNTKSGDFYSLWNNTECVELKTIDYKDYSYELFTLYTKSTVNNDGQWWDNTAFTLINGW